RNGQEVQISITFSPPIVLDPGHYFFRPEVLVSDGDFLFLSAPRPIVSPGTQFPAGVTDLQAWIRNSFLKPDWRRMGNDIVGGTTFNMTFSLSGATITPGTPGQPNCVGKTMSSLAQSFGGIDNAASGLGFESVQATVDFVHDFCRSQ